MDDICQQNGLTHISSKFPLNMDDVYRVIHGAARFYYHLRRSSTQPTRLCQKVTLECTKLRNLGYDDYLKEIFVPEGDNLNSDGTIKICVVGDKDETSYGFNIRNKWSVPLFASLFYFDLSDLSISTLIPPTQLFTLTSLGSYYQPTVLALDGMHPPLPEEGCLTVGYGTGGADSQNYFLREGQHTDVGFAKLFITTEYVDFSDMLQGSPLSCNRAMKPKPVALPPLWDTINVTIVQHRGSY
jgi:hypothetical protein